MIVLFEWRNLVLFALLLGLAIGRIPSVAPTISSCNSTLFVSGRPCNANAGDGPLKDSITDPFPSGGHKRSNLMSNSLVSAAILHPRSNSTSFTSTLIQKPSSILATPPALQPSLTSIELQHNTELRQLATIGTSTKSLIKYPSSYLLARPTNASNQTSPIPTHQCPQESHSTYVSTNTSSLTSLSSQPAKISGHNQIHNVSTAKVMQSFMLNNLSVQAAPHNGTFSPIQGGLSSYSDHGVLNFFSPSFNLSRLRRPWENASTYPPFRNITPITGTLQLFNTVSIELKDHRLQDNNDLYPPANLTAMRHCPLSNASSPHWNKVAKRFPRRQDRKTKDLYPPTWSACTERDAKFFEFTEENILSSNVIGWYARWTIEARDKRLKEFRQHGEWRSFYRWWLQEYDFRCGYDFSICRNAKTRQDVQKLYPGEENRELARRIYFVTLMYDYLHEHARMMEDILMNLHVDICAHFKELIATFTQHGNSKGKQKCAIYKYVVQTAINQSIGILNLLITGLSAPLFTADKQSKNPDALSPQVKFQVYTQIVNFVQGQTVARWDSWRQIVEDRISSEHPVIATGMGRGWAGLCASVEGDFMDQSAVNEDLLQQYVSHMFQQVRDTIYYTFRDIYAGVIEPQPGNPSFMAAIMAHRKWAGKNSIVSDIEDNRIMLSSIRTATVKQLISKLLAQSQNWMKCTHDRNAPKMCKHAKIAHELGEKGYTVDRSRFCPHPKTDPTYICEVGAWYFAEDHQHQRPMSALNNFETFWSNEFNYTLSEFFEEVYRNYERCHNNCANMSLDHVAFDPKGISTSGFAIPVCVSDHVKLDDFLKAGPQSWHFPAFCGNFAANETERFLQATNMDVNSEAAKHPLIQQLWRDRIPRELEGLSPLSYYMAMCKHNIRFPDRWKWKSSDDNANLTHNMANTLQKFHIPHHHIPDQHCGWVEDSIRGLEEMEANHFFCESRDVWKKILTQQASHVDITEQPMRRFENLQTKCKKWLKKHGGKPPYRAKPPWWVDIEDGIIMLFKAGLSPFHTGTISPFYTVPHD